MANLFLWRKASMLAVLLCGAGFLFSAATIQAADEPALEKILQKHRRATFVDVSDYVKKSPAAPDAHNAFNWLFRVGLLENMETEALPLAELYLEREEQNRAVANLAQRVRCIGLAIEGDFEGAVGAFEAVLAEARPQTATGMMGLGKVLAGRARMAGKFEASRDVLEQVSTAFSYIRQVQRQVGLGLAKHDLVGKPAPKLDASDIDGKPINLEAYKGKVVLIDFWATFCEPCLQQLPNIKKIHDDLHDRGFEIIGVSLDEDTKVVKDFREKTKINWPQVMDDVGGERISDSYHAGMIPSLYILDRKGTLVQFDVFNDDLRVTIERLLKEK